MKLILIVVFLSSVSSQNNLQEMYDYIVVGAGSAGSIVATRLSEDPKISVLLLEAGKEPPASTKSPGLFALHFLTGHDWKYFTNKQRQTNFGEYWPRGKMLGGTGSMNVALFLRGNRRDFDFWVDQGCPDWSWDKVLPYYKKIENYLETNADFTFHGTGGPINVTLVGKNDATINKFIKAAMKNGLRYRDPNDGDQTGVYHMPVNILNQVRQSSYTNYLKPAAETRSNLRVETLAFVERILFDDNNSASYVLFSKFGKQYKIKIGKEIIVCGGTVNTPQLLMLSGIGPKKHLESFGIKVVADLPVGENLADDFVVWNLHRPDICVLLDPDYLEMGNAFFNTKYSNDSNYPDMQMVMFRDWLVSFSFAVLQRPESRGRILLKSTNPRIHPKIDYQYFSDKKDLEMFSDGLTKVSSILKDMNFKETIAPNCLLVKQLNQNEYYSCRVKSLGSSAWHPVGTCKMGSSSSQASVVDCNLKVIGVNKLRVADASIFPRPTNANPQATLFMVAEKIADLIKSSN